MIARAAAVLLLGLSLAACTATAMTARNARVPVMVGPVACIGCAAAAPPAAPPVAPIADAVGRRGGYLWLPFLGDVDFFGANGPEIDLKADSLAPDACRTEIHLSKIGARSFGVVALLYAKVEQSVNIAGEILSVPSGTCGPRPWPFSGPQGIVFFAPDAAAGGAQ
jgi:hypothetical protein